MRTIVVVNQKGGAGKTTVAGHLGVEAERQGAGPVALIDVDEQGSLVEWWNVREAEAPLFAQVRPDNLPAHIAELSEAGIKTVVIDTPPQVTSLIRAALAVADLVVIPVRPGPHDLRAVGPTVDLVEAANRRMVFVVNAGKSRTRLAAETAVALSQHGTVAPVTLHDRTDFAVAMIDGRTVQELDPTGKSAEEVRALWLYLSKQLAKLR